MLQVDFHKRMSTRQMYDTLELANDGPLHFPDVQIKTTRGPPPINGSWSSIANDAVLWIINTCRSSKFRPIVALCALDIMDRFSSVHEEAGDRPLLACLACVVIADILWSITPSTVSLFRNANVDIAAAREYTVRMISFFNGVVINNSYNDIVSWSEEYEDEVIYKTLELHNRRGTIRSLSSYTFMIRELGFGLKEAAEIVNEELKKQIELETPVPIEIESSRDRKEEYSTPPMRKTSPRRNKGKDVVAPVPVKGNKGKDESSSVMNVEAPPEEDESEDEGPGPAKGRRDEEDTE
jgi:hypothetical protein